VSPSSAIFFHRKPGIEFVAHTASGIVNLAATKEQALLQQTSDFNSPGPTEIGTEPATVSAKSSKLAVKLKGKIVFVDTSDLVAVEAQGNYVLLRRESGCYRLRESISKVAKKLSPHGFIQIHRSVLVNISLVEEIRPQSTGKHSLRVKGGKEYKVARNYKENLRLIAPLWIGAGSWRLEN